MKISDDMFASKSIAWQSVLIIIGGNRVSISTAFDYYYGDEKQPIFFTAFPRQLVTGQQFKKISTDAKLLYGLPALTEWACQRETVGTMISGQGLYSFIHWMRYKKI